MNTRVNALGFSAIGKRYTNQDCIYPFDPKFKHIVPNLFIVTDGVGGENGGGMASFLAIEVLTEYLKSLKNETNSKTDFINGFKCIDQAFRKHDNTSFKGMATTFVFAYFSEKGVLFGHIGDSKYTIYKKNRLIIESKDHTLVQYLLDKGHITPTEYNNHPKKNHISRVIKAGRSTAEQMEWKVLNQLHSKMLFMLCSDGVLEAISKDELDKVLTSNIDVDDKIDILRNQCEENSKDNASCILIEIPEKKSYFHLIVCILLVLPIIYLIKKILF